MKVCEKESRIGAGIGLFTEMRVWPLPCRNNRNIIYKLKKTYKKQIDKPHHMAVTPGTQRNTPEHSFKSCSEVVPASHSGGTTLQPLPFKGCRVLAKNLFRDVPPQYFKVQGPPTHRGQGLQLFEPRLFRLFRRTYGDTHFSFA